MTDNMKKFLEEASKDQAFVEKLSKAETSEAVIALAKEINFTLTVEDLKSKETVSEISDDELEAVAGGDCCFCSLGGGGKHGPTDKTCACVAAGAGEYGDGTVRCLCALVGSGDMNWDEYQ